MNYFIRSARFVLFSTVIAINLMSSLLAQEANVLGLPAIPQPKLGASAANAAKPLTQISGNSNREVLAGEMGIQHSALNGVGRLKLTTRAIFATVDAKSAAIAAAKEVQKDLAKACAKQCKPERMSSPKLLSGGQLEFEIAFSPLHQHLTQAQFIAVLQSRPLNLTSAQLQPPETPQQAPITETVAK